MRLVFLLFILVGIPAAIIWLQVLLSKRPSKWFGLILPGVNVMLVFFVIFGMSVYSAQGTHETHNVGFYGETITETVVYEHFGDDGRVRNQAVMSIAVFVLFNIPTLVLMLIYAACRESLKKNSELNKMAIHDLS